MALFDGARSKSLVFLKRRWKELFIPLLVASLPVIDALSTNYVAVDDRNAPSLDAKADTAPTDTNSQATQNSSPGGNSDAGSAASTPTDTDEPQIVRRQFSLMNRLARQNFDFYLRQVPREPDENWPVKIVDIDESSLAAIGQWPWPRVILADLVDRLTAMGARVIVFDMVFAEPDRTSPDSIIQTWAQANSLASSTTEAVDLTQLSSLTANLINHDDVFANAIKASGRVVTGLTFNDDAASEPAYQPKRSRIVLNNANAGRGGDRGQDPGLYRVITTNPGITRNLQGLERAAAGSGHFNMETGIDGLVRRVPLIRGLHPRNETLAEDTARYYPGLALEALRVGSGNRRTRTVAFIQSDLAPPADGNYAGLSLNQVPGLEAVRVGETTIPLRRDGQVPIYFSGTRAERYIPAIDVFNNPDVEAQIADKYIFIGTSAPGLLDLRSSPLDQLIAGVEFHVELLEQILQAKFIARPLEQRAFEVLAAGTLAVLAILLLQIMGPMGSGLIVFASAGAIYGYSFYEFKANLEQVDPILPITSLALAYFTAMGFNLWRTQSEKAELRGAFGLYLSPELIDELADDPSKLTLGGEIRDLTILFSDIRGFTSISEQYDPQSLTQLINAFLTPMTGSVLNRRGTIDKYMGDALMAFWNAPLNDPEHPKNACRSAIEMSNMLGPLNKELEAEAKEAGRKFLPLNAGIGINTGPCCVGNVGSQQRFTYSVLGDAVNLAARLEGQTKSYGMAVIVGETTQAAIPDFATIELDLIRVKGKLQPVTIYGLLGEEDMAQDAEFLALEEQVNTMLSRYRAQDWDGATTALEQARRINAGLAAAEKLPRGTNTDVLFDLYIERIADYRQDPPPADWDGVFVATSK
ncbi:MAG: adenylate/guanylate cyclase domain-containing protein [Pseudomonadota bacterium]